jgi:alpha-galactosidase
MYADEKKFPGGWTNLSAYIQSKGLKAGLYSAASSVVCSGRVGSLYNEYLDAQTYASWGIQYIKYDNVRSPIKWRPPFFFVFVADLTWL